MKIYISESLFNEVDIIPYFQSNVKLYLKYFKINTKVLDKRLKRVYNVGSTLEVGGVTTLALLISVWNQGTPNQTPWANPRAGSNHKV